MKKSILKKSALAVMLLAIMSCGKDDEPITVEDSNTAPVIEAQSFMAAEDVLDSEILGTVTATDAENDALSFSIKTNSNDLFEINSAGEISLANTKTLDYKIATSHTLSIDVSDGTNTSNATITITVVDVTSVTNAVISLVTKDADRGTNSDGVVTYSLSTNNYFFSITGADADNTYQLKLTGETLNEEYFVDIEVTNNGVPQFSLDPSNIAVAPDEYTAEIYEVETNTLFDLESFQFGTGSNSVDQDYFFTINNNFNDGAISFIRVSTDLDFFSAIYEDVVSIDFSGGTNRVSMRYTTKDVGSGVYLQVFNLDGTLLQDNISATRSITNSLGTPINPTVLNQIEYYEFEDTLFTNITTSGNYLFRLVNFDPSDNKIYGYSELYESTVNLINE